MRRLVIPHEEVRVSTHEEVRVSTGERSTERGTTDVREAELPIDFELPDERARPYRLQEHLSDGPVVVLFNRGDWCAYCNGQLASAARRYDEFRARRASIVSISVDGVARNAAWADRLRLPFPLLADETAAVAAAWGVYDPAAQIARPAIFVVAPDLSVPLRYLGRDYADRPPFAALLAALDGLAERRPRTMARAVRLPGPREPRDSGKRAMPLGDLAPYLRGANFGVAALAGRSADPLMREEAKRYQEMLAEFLRHVAATERIESRPTVLPSP